MTKIILDATAVNTLSEFTFQDWADAGWADGLVPVIPPGAILAPECKLRPDQLGKIPGWLSPRGWKAFTGSRTALGHGTAADFALWQSWGATIGYFCRDAWGIDIDLIDAAAAKLVVDLAQTMLMPKLLDWAPHRVGNAPKTCLFFRWPAGFRLNQVIKVEFADIGAIEIRPQLNYLNLSGVHPCGRPYTWSVHELPRLLNLVQKTEEQARAFVVAATDLLLANGYATATKPEPAAQRPKANRAADRPNPNTPNGNPPPTDDVFLPRAIAWLRKCPPAIEGQHGDDLTAETAFNLSRFEGATVELVFEAMFGDWNDRCAPPWMPKDLRTKIRSAFSKPGAGTKQWAVDAKRLSDKYAIPPGAHSDAIEPEQAPENLAEPIEIITEAEAVASGSGAAVPPDPEPQPTTPEEDNVADFGAHKAKRQQKQTQQEQPRYRSPPKEGYANKLIPTTKGNPLFFNACAMLRYAPELKGRLSYNELRLAPFFRGSAPWPSRDAILDTEIWEWTEDDDNHLLEWMQERRQLVGITDVGRAVQTVSREALFHPIRDFLNSLTWDGVARLDTWAIDYLGCEDTPYVRAVTARWPISAVARIYEPGCKADCALILEGDQGVKKSTALETMFQPWFADEIADLGGKDAAMQTAGIWCIEIAELDSMARAEISKIKAFISRKTDRFRPPYGKRVAEFPRQSVFCGSTNVDDWNRDPTGARRFWPVTPTAIDKDGLAAVRDQLFAEAVVRYRAGSRWWIDDTETELVALAKAEQAARYSPGPWDDEIARFLEHPGNTYVDTTFGATTTSAAVPMPPLDHVSVGQIFDRVLQIKIEHRKLTDARLIAACLVHLGWKGRVTNAGGLPKGRWYFRPGKITVATVADEPNHKVNTDDDTDF